MQWNKRDKVEQDTQFDLRGAKAEDSLYTVMGNKTNEARLECCLHRCGCMTYIWRVEECWSLSDVGYGLRTRQVILAHKPLIFSFTVFSTTRGSCRVGERAALIDVAIEFDSCYILQGEPWSIRCEPGQGYIKGIPVNPQHSTVSVSPFQTDAKVIVFLSRLFREKTRSYWLPVSPVAPLSSLVIQSHLSSFQECTSVSLSCSPSLFSPDRGALGSLGTVCVWLSQIYSSSLLKRDTVTSSVSGGLHPRPLSEMENLRGEGEATQWLVRRQAENMSRTGTTERWYWIWGNGPAGMFCSEFMLTVPQHFGSTLRAICCSLIVWLP